MKKFSELSVPHVFTILILVIIFAGILTYIVPAGQYDTVIENDTEMIDPGSFTFIEQTPVSPFGWFIAIPEGIARSAPIIALIFIAMGAISVYMKTDSFQVAVVSLLNKENANPKVIMFIIMAFFAIRGGFEGAIDSHIAFVPLTVGFALAAGYDVMTGVAISMVPTFVSFGVGPTNPYTVLISQEIAGLPPFSGMAYRTIAWAIIMIITFHHVFKYASKVKKDPSLSVTKDIDVSDMEIDVNSEENLSLTKRQKILLIMLGLTIFIIILGAIRFGWWLNQMSAAFLISGILAGIVAGFKNEKIAKIFIDAGGKVYMGAMCVGIARAIEVILERGNIIDTIIYGTSTPLQGLPTSVAAGGMYFVQLIINFFIPSGSGQAVVTMPILAPLADVLNITRQTAVMAFQMGDGITNLVFPTMGLIFAYLSLGKVSFDQYLKYIWPLAWKVLLLGLIFTIIAAQIQYGPF